MNDSQSNQTKYVPIVICLTVGIMLLFFTQTTLFFSRKSEAFESERLKLDQLIEELLLEKNALLKQIDLYESRHDSILTIITKNNQSANDKIKSLHNLTNDELRKIANE